VHFRGPDGTLRLGSGQALEAVPFHGAAGCDLSDDFSYQLRIHEPSLDQARVLKSV